MRILYWLTPDGKRVYKVRQMLNQNLSYRIVTVLNDDQVERGQGMLVGTVQKRWGAFASSAEAQAALDQYAQENHLTPYNVKERNI